MRGSKWQEVYNPPLPMLRPVDLRPVPAETREAAVDIPKLQATFGGYLFGLLLGVLMGAIAGLIAAWVRSPIWYWIALITALVFALIGFASYSLIDFRQSRDHWEWRLERILNRDLDGDDIVGQPQVPVPTRTLHVVMTDKTGHHQKMFDPPYPGAMNKLAEIMMNHGNYSIEAITGEGKPISKPQYIANRDAMIDRGIAKWRNPKSHNGGWKPTPDGWNVINEIYQSPAAGEDEQN